MLRVQGLDLVHKKRAAKAATSPRASPLCTFRQVASPVAATGAVREEGRDKVSVAFCAVGCGTES